MVTVDLQPTRHLPSSGPGQIRATPQELGHIISSRHIVSDTLPRGQDRYASVVHCNTENLELMLH